MCGGDIATVDRESNCVVGGGGGNVERLSVGFFEIDDIGDNGQDKEEEQRNESEVAW